MTLKAHIGLHVRSVDESLRFYRAFFCEEPVKVMPGYAKFDLADPVLNFSLTESSLAAASPGHFGIQVTTTLEVAAAAKRLADAGLATYEEMGTTCCYALQDKVWSTDPDGNRWEVFVVQADSQTEGEFTPVVDAPCCVK
jgi:catechol 2,3-dioxygenase-like lactoylglutathione lyase family enzyme